MRLAAYAGFGCSATFFACVVAGFTTGNTAAIATLEYSAAIALGITAWVGIVRHGLFDTRAVLSRDLGLRRPEPGAAAIYLLVVVGLGLVAGGLLPRSGPRSPRPWRCSRCAIAATPDQPMGVRAARRPGRRLRPPR